MTTISDLELLAQQSFVDAVTKFTALVDHDMQQREQDMHSSQEVLREADGEATCFSLTYPYIPAPMNPAEFSKESNLFVRYVVEVKKLPLFDLVAGLTKTNDQSDPENVVRRLWLEFVVDFNSNEDFQREYWRWYKTLNVRSQAQQQQQQQQQSRVVRIDASYWPVAATQQEQQQDTAASTPPNSTTNYDWGSHFSISAQDRSLGAYLAHVSNKVALTPTFAEFLGVCQFNPNSIHDPSSSSSSSSMLWGGQGCGEIRGRGGAP